MFSESTQKIIQQNVSLAPFCWLKIGGAAQYYAAPDNLADLETLCREAFAADLPVRVLGGGSNLLVRESGVEGLVLKLGGNLANITVDGTKLVAGAGAELGEVINRAAAAGLAGIEELAGIPGSIGGAVASNSGVKNDDIGSRVLSVKVIDRNGQLVVLDKDALQFGFRRSNLEDVVIVEAVLQLEESEPEEITRRLQAAWIVRKAAQPSTGATVAQAFIEPSGRRIADLLDASGTRTASEGEASMSSQHPGFVVVNESATTDDVIALTTKISRAVEVQSGIQLQPQLKIW